MGNLKRYLACKSTKNKNVQADMDDDLDNSKFNRAQVWMMKKNKSKTLDNANKTVQDTQSAVHGDWEREEATKKRAEADANDAHVRELQTALSCQANIDEVKVEYHHRMQDQAKCTATLLAKDKVTAQKKMKKHAAASEEIVRDASQNISQLKHEVSFKKLKRDCKRLSGK